MKGINIKDRNYELYSVVKNNEVFTLELTKQDLIKYASELQERINKAIEYINENWGHWCSNHCKYATETINILKGDDK